MQWLSDIETFHENRRELQPASNAVLAYLALRRAGGRFTGKAWNFPTYYVFRFQMPDGARTYLHLRRPPCTVCSLPVEGEDPVCDNCLEDEWMADEELEQEAERWNRYAGLPERGGYWLEAPPA